MSDNFSFADLRKPKEASTYPSPFRPSEEKDLDYDLTVCKATYWNSWNLTSSPFGNYWRNNWIDNRLWARGTQSNAQFAIKPNARNDHTKAPWLNHINFNSVNEMVKYCDQFTSALEKYDWDIIAKTINPAASEKKGELMSLAEAYRQLRPFFQQIEAQAGAKITPTNPINNIAVKGNFVPIEFDYSNEKELDLFFSVAFKLKEELRAELGFEQVALESDWQSHIKLGIEDIRDLGYIGFMIENDLANRIRFENLDLVNCGWEDYRGHRLERMTRFWRLTVKTGAQIVAESAGTLSYKDVYDMATYGAGKFGNPMMPANGTQLGFYGYINTDGLSNGYSSYFFDSWKFPVLEAWWEDWEIMKYRKITRTADGKMLSFEPVDFKYKDKNNGQPYLDANDNSGTPTEKRIEIKQSDLHYYRHCKWVVGTDVGYDNGPVKNCPRNPYDTRFALSPIKLYRAAGMAPAGRIKSIAQIQQNAWFKLQNEIARARVQGYSVDIKGLNNVTSMDGKRITRRDIMNLFNEEGILVWSSSASQDDQGVTRTQEPIRPLANVDIIAMQRWWDTIQNCSSLMAKELGWTEPANGNLPGAETSATAINAAMQGSENSLVQFVDAMKIIKRELAIDVCSRLEIMRRNGETGQYESSIGAGILDLVPGSGDDTLFHFGVEVMPRPTQQERQQLKATLQQSYASLATPDSGSPYLSDLLWLQSLIDKGTNLTIVSLIASYMQKKNMEQVQQNQAQQQQNQVQGNAQNLQQASQMRMQEKAQEMQLEAQLDDHRTQNQMKLKATDAQVKGGVQSQLEGQKAESKKEMILLEKQVQ